MRIEVWSDVVCPWCFIGKRRLEQALARFPHRDEVEVVWRAFELDPAAPRERTGRYEDHLAAKYGTDVAQAQGMTRYMTEVAAQDDIDMRFDLARPGSTVDAHRLLHLAAEQGAAAQDALKERLLVATFTEGEPVGDPETLVRLAVAAGLAEDAVREVLSGDRFAVAVRAEEAEAAALGATGVPFFVVDRRYGVAGAQPADVLLEVLERAWQDSRPLTLVGAAGASAAAGPADGDGCSDGSCAV